MRSPFIGGRRSVPLLPCAVMLLAACGQGGGANSNGPKMTNVPGAVIAAPTGSANLTGHFEIRLAQPGDPFVFSSGGGGACVLTQYPATPKSCMHDSDCGLPASGIGDGASSYCIPESPGRPTAGGGSGSLPPNGAGTCWIKPSESFCLKRVGAGPHDTPPADTTVVAVATGVKKWRVLACLNGAPGACGGAPATPNELQDQAGPVYTAP